MNALGIIFSNIHDENVPELTSNRTMAAIPFGARYRLIDFPLSSMVNSGIRHVGVITKRNYRSLMDHVGSGKDWDLARNHKGFVLLPPFGEFESNALYGTRLEALKTVLGFITRCDEEYVIMSDSNAVYNIDFTKMLAYHIEKQAAVTLLYVEKNSREISGTNNVILKVEDGDVKDLSIDPKMSGKVKLYGNICLMKRELILSLVSDAISHGKRHFAKEVLTSCVRRMKVVGYEHEKFFEDISSLDRFYQVNMALLKKEVRQDVFESAEIYTKIKDSAPTKYGANAVVKNSFIADGCQIEGEVYNSVLARGVKVGRGTVIKNCVLMKNSIIGENVQMNAIVTDKNVVVRDRRVLSGCETHPFYIRKDVTV